MPLPALAVTSVAVIALALRDVRAAGRTRPPRAGIRAAAPTAAVLPAAVPEGTERRLGLRDLPRPLWLFVVATGLFTLGNSSDAFLLLRATHDEGQPLSVDGAAPSLEVYEHHGEYETSIYIVDGVFRIEFGAGGSEQIEARAGDFLHVPPGAVHRETNPESTPSHVVVVRSGSGEAVTLTFTFSEAVAGFVAEDPLGLAGVYEATEPSDWHCALATRLPTAPPRPWSWVPIAQTIC